MRDTPVWRYLVNGIEIEKEAAMRQGENTAAVVYRVRNRSRADAVLSITPFLQFVSKGSDLGPEQEFRFRTAGQRAGGWICMYRRMAQQN